MSELNTSLETLPTVAEFPGPIHNALHAPLCELPLENSFAGWAGIYKRFTDIAGSSFAILFFGIPMLLIAIAINLDDGGPIFYAQRRLSRGRRTFTMLKFRTMKTDAESAGPVFARENDMRCTRLGRWLRASCLDELPQFFNILKGDMSLVGPRPERPEMLAAIERDIPDFPLRLRVRAGLTGWAQVHGYRGRTCFRSRLQYDLDYLKNWSPLLDIRIMWTTVIQTFRPPQS